MTTAKGAADDFVRIGLLEGELIPEGFDSVSRVAPALGARRERTVAPSLNDAGKQMHKSAAFGGRAATAI